jgi:uncharacterized protein YlxP (DUF503 family)
VSYGLLTIQIRLPGCASLKEKRSRLRPLITRLHREFNISIAEMDHLDSWQEAVLACALVSNSNGHTQRSLQIVVEWVEKNWPDVLVVSENVEIL